MSLMEKEINRKIEMYKLFEIHYEIKKVNINSFFYLNNKGSGKNKNCAK